MQVAWRDRLARVNVPVLLIALLRNRSSTENTASPISGEALAVISTSNPPNPSDSFIDGVIHSSFQRITIFADVVQWSIGEDFTIVPYEGHRYDLISNDGDWRWTVEILPPLPPHLETTDWIVIHTFCFSPASGCLNVRFSAYGNQLGVPFRLFDCYYIEPFPLINRAANCWPYRLPELPPTITITVQVFDHSETNDLASRLQQNLFWFRE